MVKNKYFAINIDATADKIQFDDVIVAQGQNHPFRKLVVTRFL
jgi:hypothetical protein